MKERLKNMKIGTAITLSATVGILFATTITIFFEKAIKYQFPDLHARIESFFGHTGYIYYCIFWGFLTSIAIVSLITGKIISKPLNEISKGAEELSKGNLDYVINYEGTNELGKTAESLYEMTKKLQHSIEEQYNIEESRKEMIAGAAHDLRTPLTLIKGYVEGLMDGIANTPEKQKEYLETIHNATLNMEKLLDELLTVSRLETGKIELFPEAYNAKDFITEFYDNSIYPLEKREIKVFLDTSELDNDAYIMLDTERILRVFTNIFGNSIKYASKARGLELNITAQSDSDSVIITISDNGIGISKENLPHIFDMFFRADQARTRVSEGSGLGLAVCKEIIELHGGKIWATSVEGESTSIHILLNRITKENNNE